MPTGYAAGSAYSIYRLDLSGFDQDVARIKSEIAALQKQASVPSGGASPARSSGTNGAAISQIQQLQRAQAGLELQQARLARASGDTVRAAELQASAQQRLRSILDQTTSTTTQTIAVEKQLASIQTQVAKETGAAGQAAQQAAGGLGGLAAAAGPVAVAFGAFKIAQQVGEFSAYGQALQQTRTSFDSLAVAAHTTGDVLLGSLRAAAAGTISDAKLIESANSGLLLTGGKIATELPRLIEIARASSKATGEDIGFIFDSLVKGIARGSPQIIDNAKITLDAAKAFDDYGKTIGKSGDQLNRAEQQQATLNAVLAEGVNIIRTTGGAADPAANSYARLGTAAENLKNNLAGAAATLTGPAAAGLARLLEGSTGVDQALQGMSDSIRSGDQAFTFLARAFGITAEGADYARTTLENLGIITSQEAAQWTSAGGATIQAAQAHYVAADAADRAAASSQGVSGALADELSQKIAGSQATDQLAQLQSQLDADSRAAAQGLFAAGDQATALASKYGIAASQAQFLIAQQAKLGLAAGLAEQRAGERNPGESGAAEAADTENRRLQALYRTLADPPKPPRISGGGGGGGGRSPAAARLSDQQRLNNTLLTDQQKANDRAEQEAETHQKNILKIEKDYQEKSLQQQRQNEISKRQSQADFYDRLTSSDLNKGKGQDKAALQGINADYQSAFAKSQELAQQGRAKEASDYLALKQRQLEQELSYQEAVAKARADKDKGEEARLTTIQNLRRQAAAEEEKQLLEGGDQNQKARDDALAAEDTRYSDAQTKIQESSDRAAERKIANAERSGKAIDAENAKLAQQEGIYARLPSGSQGAPTAPTTPPSAPAPNAADVRPVNDAALLGAVQAQTDMQRGKFDLIISRLGDVERAVRQGRGGVAA